MANGFAHKRYHALSSMDSYGHAVLAVNRRGRIVYSNSAAGVAFGYAPSSLIGLAVESLLPRNLEQIHREHVRCWFDSPVPLPLTGIRGSLPGRRSDGTPQLFAIFIVPFLIGEAPDAETVALAQIYPRNEVESMFAHAKRSNLKASVTLAAVALLEALRFAGVI